MIIIKLKGGLGNQMFQYATGKALALRNNTEFKIDLSFLIRKGLNYVQREFGKDEIINYELGCFQFNPIFASRQDIPYIERIKSKFIYDKIYCRLDGIFNIYKWHHLGVTREKHYNFDDTIFNLKKGYIEGYFQTYKYFDDFKEEIKKDFQFKTSPLKDKNDILLKDIINLNSVGVHIRRGDYEKKRNSFIGLQNIEYYRKAIDLVNSKLKNPTLFFFSDDIEWVKTNIKTVNKSYYINWNTGRYSYEDMRLLSLCKHNIIANSTFSWWGGWLNENPDKIVIAPRKWFHTENINYNDVIPNNWIKL